MATNNTPSENQHLDGKRHIHNAARQLTAARMEMMRAHNRLNDFLNAGIVPDDLKRGVRDFVKTVCLVAKLEPSQVRLGLLKLCLDCRIGNSIAEQLNRFQRVRREFFCSPLASIQQGHGPP